MRVVTYCIEKFCGQVWSVMVLMLMLLLLLRKDGDDSLQNRLRGNDGGG
jgi:hypothetical protein